MLKTPAAPVGALNCGAPKAGGATPPNEVEAPPELPNTGGLAEPPVKLKVGFGASPDVPAPKEKVGFGVAPPKLNPLLACVTRGAFVCPNGACT